jgi:hypothetical protein
VRRESWFEFKAAANAQTRWNPVAGALGLPWFIASFAIALGVVLIMLGFKVRSARGA